MEIDFLQAVKILESDNNEKLLVGKDFYELLKKNQLALDISLQTDEETVYAPSSNRDSATKVLKILKSYRKKHFDSFTDTEENFWQSANDSLENGAIAKKTVNTIYKEIKNETEVRKILETLKRRVSFNDFVKDEKPEIKVNSEASKVILSEYLLA